MSRQLKISAIASVATMALFALSVTAERHSTDAGWTTGAKAQASAPALGSPFPALPFFQH